MRKAPARAVSVLLLLAMVGGNLNICSLAAPGPENGDNSVGAGPRSLYTISQTAVSDWKGGSLTGLTVFNESGGELRLSGLEYIDFGPVNVQRVRDMEVDGGGNLYVATQAGEIVRIQNGTDVITACGRAVPDEDNILCLVMDRNDTLWGAGRSFAGVTPNRGGIIWRMNTTTMRFDAAGKADMANAAVWGICADRNGTVWAGTASGIVARVDPTTGAITRLNGGNPLVPGYGIMKLAAAPNGMIYAATSNNGPGGLLLRIDPSTNTFNPLNSNLPVVNNDGVTVMVAAGDGNIWGGTGNNAGNIFVVNTTTDRITLLGKPVAGCGSVWDMYPAPDGSVYGSAGGGALADNHLFRIDTAAAVAADIVAPFAGNTWPGIVAVAPDGTVWGSGQNQMLYRMAPEYPRHPAARLDRPVTGRIFTENFEMGDINWDTAPSNPNPVSFTRVADASRPAGDTTVYEEKAFSASAYAKAGSPGPIQNNQDAFPGAPASVMEVSFKLNISGSTTPYGVRLFMDWYNNNQNYGLFFYEDTDQVMLFRDNIQIGQPYSGMSLTAGSWYDVKWKVWHPAGGPGAEAGISVWVNGTRIFDSVPLVQPFRQSGSVVVGTRFYDASFDNLRLYKDTNITVNGLQIGQNVMLHASDGTLVASNFAAGASAVLNVNATSFPLAGYFNITDTDGVTVSYTSPVYADIFGGDIYTLDKTPLGSSWKYFTDGSYLSQPLDAGWSVHWKDINWTALVPGGTALSVRTRTAPTAALLPDAAWSPVYSANPYQIASPDNRWLQFQATFKTGDPRYSPDLRDITVQYEAFPNFTIGLAQSADTLYPDDVVTYTINFSQTGNGPARDAWISDGLSPMLEFLNSSDEANRTGMAWHMSLLPPSWTGSLKISAHVPPEMADNVTITNMARINFTDFNGTPLGNYSSEAVSARVVRPKISLEMSGPAAAGPGDLLAYSVWFNNTGNASAADLWLNLTLDNNLSVVNSSSEGARLGNSWHFTNVAGPNRLDLSGRVDPSTPDGATLNAGVFVNFTLPNGYQPEGVSAGPARTKISGPVIDLQKSGSVTARPGDAVGYSILYRNTGSASATNFTITDVLAPELDFLGSDPARNGTGNSWTFQELRGSYVGRITITARVRNDTAEGTVIKNRASASFSTMSGVQLPGKASNEVSTTIGAPAEPNITVTLQADRTVAGWNDTVNFTAGYDNLGDGNALVAIIAAELPAGMALVSSSEEGYRAGTAWIFSSVAGGAHNFTFTVKIGTGIADYTVLAANLSLNYTDARGRQMPPSQASVPVTVRASPVIPPGTKPSIIDRSPGPGATNVARDAVIRITFNTPMNRATISAAFSISPAVQGTIGWDGNTLVFTPTKRLSPGTRYTISITTAAQDDSGNALDQGYTWHFTTETPMSAGISGTPWVLMAIVPIIVMIVVGIMVLAIVRKGMKDSEEEEGAYASYAAARAGPPAGTRDATRTGGRDSVKPREDPPSIDMPVAEDVAPTPEGQSAPDAPEQARWDEEPEALAEGEAENDAPEAEGTMHGPSGRDPPVRDGQGREETELDTVMKRLKMD